MSKQSKFSNRLRHFLFGLLCVTLFGCPGTVTEIAPGCFQLGEKDGVPANPYDPYYPYVDSFLTVAYIGTLGSVSSSPKPALRLIYEPYNKPGAWSELERTRVSIGATLYSNVRQAIYTRLAIIYGIFDPYLSDRYTAALVTAHEMGHFVQNRLGKSKADNVSRVGENVSDMWAGFVFGSSVINTYYGPRQLSRTEVQAVMSAGYLGVESTSYSTAGTHGTTQQRTQSLVFGFDQGVQFRTDHSGTPPTLEELQTLQAEFETQAKSILGIGD